MKPNTDNPDKANPNMKTDTQTQPLFGALGRMLECDAQEVRPLIAKAAQADKLAEALRGLIAEVKLGKLNVRKDFSLMNAHAYAGKCLHQYESEVQR
jgi:hypothetical protein